VKTEYIVAISVVVSVVAVLGVLVVIASNQQAHVTDRNLLVSSFATDQVKRYNGTTGIFIDNFASGGGLDGPNRLGI